MKKIYTSIDIGTDSIKVIVCELYRNKLNLLATSSVHSQGIKKGLIADFEKASLSLKEAITEVETMIGIRITKALVSVPEYFAEFNLVKAQIDIVNEENRVTGNDVIKVLNESIKSKRIIDKEMVNIIPISFNLDDKEGILLPNGLIGKKLSVKAILVTVPKKNVYSVLSLLENIGIEVVDISINSIGDIYAFKNKEIDNSVGAIINIGADTVNVSIYNKGYIVKSSIINMGGNLIDNDIAYMYKISLEEARKIKEQFALAHKKNALLSEVYETTNNNLEKIAINQYEVSEIVESRIEEILFLAKKEVNLLTNKEIEYIIVTGGTSNMTDFEYVMDDALGKKATIGLLHLIGLRNNMYSSVVGNIVYFINKLILKGQKYSMISEEDADDLSSVKKNSKSGANELMLSKVFGHFFSK